MAGYPENPYLHFQTATDFEGHAGSLVGLDPDGFPEPDDAYHLNGKCMRIRAGSRYLDAYTSGDGDVVTRTYQDNTTQLWGFVLTGNDMFRISHRTFSGQLLDAYESSNGHKAMLRDLQSGWSQSWIVGDFLWGFGFTLTQFSTGRKLDYLNSAEDDYRAITTSSGTRWLVVED